MQRIISRQNAVVAQYREAARGAADGTLLLDGAHIVSEALEAGLRFQHVVIASDALDRPEITRILSRLARQASDVVEASRPVMDAVSPVRSSSPIVALAARPLPSHSPMDGAAPLVVVICDVQDPGNVGAIIRVAEGAGASGVIVAGQSADPFGWKALRGSMGSALRLPIISAATVEDAVRALRQAGAQVIATVPRHGTSLFEAALTGPAGLLIGGEGLGLSEAAVADADARVTIPMEAPVESLNAAVAAAILLYEARRQRMGRGAPRARERG